MANIFKSLGLFFAGLYHAILNDLEHRFNQLPDEEQKALIEGGQFGQLIKSGLDDGVEAIEKKAADLLGWTPEQIQTAWQGLASKLGLPGTSDFGNNVIDHLQSEVDSILEDSAWDALWTTVSGQLQIVLGGGKINWVIVASGFTEFVYVKFVKGKL